MAAKTEIGELQVLITAQADQFNTEISKLKQQLSSVQGATNKASKSISGFGSIIKKAIPFALITAGFMKLNKVVKESDVEYANTAASMTKLATVMQMRGATQEQYNEVIKLTEAEERLGVVSAGVMQNGLQELATYVAKAQSLKDLTNTMNNLIVQQHGYNATAEQSLQTATMMGKVLQGQTGGMERIGYHLTEAEKELFNFGTEEQRVALLAEIVNGNLGNMNRRLGETNVGKQVQLANTWAQLKAQIGELSSAVGNVLIPVFSAIANVVGRAIAYIKAFLKLFGVDTGNAAASTADGLQDAAEAGEAFGDGVASGAKKAKRALAAFDEMNVLEDSTSSGSGGGGGGGVDILADAIAGIDAIDWGSLIPEIKLPKWIQNLINQIKELIDGFDFAKISKALKRFWDDVNKFLKPVGGILGDLWDKHLEPFLHWTGNDLLPAFLNALGGALSFVGAILEKSWAVFSSFYDVFLRPIVEFTGGVIVTVLNAIGDALRWLSEQQGFIDFMVEVAAIVASVYGGLTLLGGALGIVAGATGLDLMNDSLARLAPMLKSYDAGVQMMGTATEGLKGILSGIGEKIFSPMSIAILGVVAAYEGFKVVTELVTLRQMQKELQDARTITSEEQMQNAINQTNEGLKRQQEALDAINGIMVTHADAKLALMEAEDNESRMAQKLTEVRNIYGENSREYEKAELQLQIASTKVKDAQDKLNEVVSDGTAEYESHTDAVIQEIRGAEEAAITAEFLAGNYKKVQSELERVANGTYEYTDANGKMAKLTANDTKLMAEMITNSMREATESRMKNFQETSGIQHRWWDEDLKKQEQHLALTHAVAKKFETTWQNSVSDLGAYYDANTKKAGEAFSQGVAEGIKNNTWRVQEQARLQARAGENAFKGELKIKSPSRVMAKSGGWFSEGVAEGIGDNTYLAENAATDLAKVTADAFDGYSLDTKLLENVSKIPPLDTITGSLDINTEKTMQPLTIKLGDETIFDRIIDYINDRSLMRNANVIDI
ncbi:hypothetical protein LJC07_04775 [Christensenellaceae bacterium OttesenSCG-928-L17]|nr:hypothetical protein [Christensenellaceae bacterium OttesenSCG-928-L17]